MQYIMKYLIKRYEQLIIIYLVPINSIICAIDDKISNKKIYAIDNKISSKKIYVVNNKILSRWKIYIVDD